MMKFCFPLHIDMFSYRVLAGHIGKSFLRVVTLDYLAYLLTDLDSFILLNYLKKN